MFVITTIPRNTELPIDKLAKAEAALLTLVKIDVAFFSPRTTRFRVCRIGKRVLRWEREGKKETSGKKGKEKSNEDTREDDAHAQARADPFSFREGSFVWSLSISVSIYLSISDSISLSVSLYLSLFLSLATRTLGVRSRRSHLSNFYLA